MEELEKGDRVKILAKLIPGTRRLTKIVFPDMIGEVYGTNERNYRYQIVHVINKSLFSSQVAYPRDSGVGKAAREGIIVPGLRVECPKWHLIWFYREDLEKIHNLPKDLFEWNEF